jgi:tetratricopeptide (TPR) repeat protein
MLDERFRILSGGDRAALPRLQTMRATIDWSFALLAEPERVLLRRLTIFVDDWTLEAAEAVCSCAGLAVDQILDLLASLVDKSLVTAEFSSGRARYSFLESIRAYALEQIAAADERETLARCLAEWAADYSEWHAEQEFTRAQTSDPRDYPEPTVHESSNRQAALEWALGAGQALLAGRIAGSYVWIATTAPDARRLIERALSLIRETEHRSVEARLWQVLGHWTRGERSFAAAQKAIRLFEEIGERSHWLASGFSTLQGACRSTGRRAEALAAGDLLLALLHELAATGTFFHFHALRDHAEVLKDLRRYQESRQCIADAMELSSLRPHCLQAKNSLAELEFDMGNPRQAVAVAEEAAGAVPEDQWDRLFSSDRSAMSALRFNAAAYRLMLGEVEEARLAALDALKLAPRWYSSISGRNVAIPAQHLATVAALRGDADRAARLMGYVDGWYAAAGEVREPTEQRTYEILVAALKKRLREADIERLAVAGALLDEEAVRDMALAIARTPV